MASARMNQGRSIAALDGGELMELMDCNAGMMEQGTKERDSSG